MGMMSVDASQPGTDRIVGIEVAPPSSESLRETIESIVVAFILAFVFRAFVVEAFRIPTGSMAPTLYGDHGQMRCEECAYPFAFNMRQETLPQDFEVICPNCTARNVVHASAAKPYRALGGDRILVLKWPYDIGGAWLGPQRWDVSVFKDPKDSQTNFIKRLTGLPGEVFEIVDGDVYAVPADRVPESIRNKLKPNGAPRLSESEVRRLNGLLKIQRKTALAQKSLWLLHYDHDFPSAHRDDRHPYWAAPTPSGWKTDAPRIRFDGGDAEQTIALAGKPIEDFYGYNGIQTWAYPLERSVDVGDVRLQFVLVPQAGATQAGSESRLSVSLAKDGWTFTARLHADGLAELLLRRPQRPEYDEKLAEFRGSPLEPGRPLSVAMQNVDYRVSLQLNDQTVLETNEATYAPHLDELRRRDSRLVQRKELDSPRASMRIGAAGIPLELRHVRVYRDVYYRAATDEYRFAGGYPGSGRGTGGNPILLRDGEFFMCGDNSPQSKDSRLWIAAEVSPFLQSRGDDYQVGTVPADQMIGRAFFVYWPAGKPLLVENGPAIVPDVGRMRWIR